MNEYVIITDSTCDLTSEMAAELGIHVIPMGVNIGADSIRHHLDGRELGFGAFYERLRAGESASTNAVNLGDYLDAAEPYLEKGLDVLFAAFSSALSTTYSTSEIAVGELLEKYPDRKLFAVDTLCASMGEGLLVWHAARLKQAGGTIEEVRDWLEANKLHLCHWFTVDDLNHLKRGGRVSGATALVGTMLGIKPVLHVDNEGHLVKTGTARGRQASLKALLDKMAETALDPGSQTVFVSHGDCESDALWLAERVKERFGVREVAINYIGPVIGTHSGPGTIALFFLGSAR